MRKEQFESGETSETLSVSTVSADLTITGNLTSKGEIRFEGQIQGDIRCTSLILGENAQLKGSAIAKDVIIRGRLIGCIRALRVRLQSKCHVEGHVIHQDLTMEEGAYFEGKSRPSEDPMSSGQTAIQIALAKAKAAGTLAYS